MGIYNEILSPRYAYMLQKLFGIKGGVPAKQLSGELMAMLPLFNGAENRYLEGWNLFAVSNGFTAAGGNLAAVRLRNPTGSNMVVVFEGVWINSSGAGDIPFMERGAIGVDLANPIAFTTNKLDARSKTPASALSLSNGNRVAFGALYAQFGVGANTKLAFIDTDIQEIPLLPGDGIQLVSNVVNTTVNASFRWRERLLEESERFL